MRIIFFCGSLEPGKDGVGDYTRRLGAELMNQAHNVMLIALHDPHITSIAMADQQVDGMSVSVVRIPSNKPYSTQKETIKRIIKDFKPDYLSLQFVPFAFHPKGLPLNLISFLKDISSGRKWHIMFHELWVGMDRHDPSKNKLWGWLQKLVIRRLIAALKPSLIHTQTKLYISMLGKMGYKALHLPLFGNIPDISRLANGNNEIMKDNSSRISLLVFGSIHHSAPIVQLASDMAAYNNVHGTNAVLRFIGRCGAQQDTWQTIWRSKGLDVEVFGEQSEESISRHLLSAHFGLSTTPELLIGKSGSVAAMLQHRLPVISVCREWQPHGYTDISLPEGVTHYDAGKLEDIISNRAEPKDAKDLSSIASQLVENLLSLK